MTSYNQGSDNMGTNYYQSYPGDNYPGQGSLWSFTIHRLISIYLLIYFSPIRCYCGLIVLVLHSEWEPSLKWLVIWIWYLFDWLLNFLHTYNRLPWKNRKLKDQEWPDAKNASNTVIILTSVRTKQLIGTGPAGPSNTNKSCRCSSRPPSHLKSMSWTLTTNGVCVMMVLVAIPMSPKSKSSLLKIRLNYKSNPFKTVNRKMKKK